MSGRKSSVILSPMNKIDNIGIIAGRGHYPFLMSQEARTHGVKNIAIVGLRGDGSPKLEACSDTLDWAYPGQLNKTIKHLKRRGISQAVMVGQVKPGRLFKGLRPDLKTLKILLSTPERNADSLFSAVCDEFNKAGIEILPAITFLEDHLAHEGVMNKVKLDKSRHADLEFGFRMAKEISRLDIGQSIVVKKGTILAVEGFEGTDKAIRRGGELGRGGVTVAKVSKPNHDLRFDVPCIGMRTVESLIAARARTLVVEAGLTLFIEKERVLAALDDAKICVVGKKT